MWPIPAGAACGSDGAEFALSTAGALACSAAKDFESRGDVDSDGTYEVTVKVSDGATMWISVWAGPQVLAHDLDGGQRLPGKDISTAPSGTLCPNGVWFYGGVAWVVDDEAKTVYACATPA